MATRRIGTHYNDESEGIATDESKCTRPFKISNKKCTKYHFFAFWLTFFSYALFHAARKTFSNVKASVSATWTPQNLSLPAVFDQNWNGHNLFKDEHDASIFLGLLDTVFMTSYSIGLFISGAIGDRLNLKHVLAFGMCSSSVTVLLFGLASEELKLYNKVWYVIFWSLTGFFQSTGWPTVVAIIGNWFGKSSRGFIMGIWGACPSVGNIIGAYAVAAVLHFGYQYSFLVTGSIIFAAGIIIEFSLIPSPRDVGLPDPDGNYSKERSPDEEPLLHTEICTKDKEVKRQNSERPEAIGLCHAFCLPGVMAYSFAYACLKLVNYSFFFWLPYYLHKAYNWPESLADKLSVWYDVGGIIGGIVIGYLSDKLEHRSPVVGLMLILSPIVLLIYSDAPRQLEANAALMTLTGIVIGGVSSLISTAVSADLGRQPELSKSKEALSTVTGIIDGTGSAGAAIGQLLVPVIMNAYDWKAVFYLFIAMTLCTLLCIIHIIYRDTMHLIRNWLNRNNVSNIAHKRLINAERQYTIEEESS